MALFRQVGEDYTGTLQCRTGRDAFLRITLSDGEADDIEMYQLEPMKDGLSLCRHHQLWLEGLRYCRGLDITSAETFCVLLNN